MKVLHISRSMGQGGAQKVVCQLCQDIKATHFIASCGGVHVEPLNEIGVKHFMIPDMDGKNPIDIIKTIFILIKVVKTEKIEIVHSHHRMAAFYARILQFVFPNLKHIYTSHNVFKGQRKLLAFALSKAQVIACGDTVKKNLTEEYGICDSKVIYNSVKQAENLDCENEVIKKEIEKGSYLIGNIGRLSEQKALDVFIKAIAIVAKKNSNVKGVIIGDGEDREKLESLVNELEIQKNIIFLGYQKNIFSLINKMQFIVLSSRWEGFPLTPIETFSVGKTIIVSDIKNNLEIVEPQKNGLSFEKDNVDDLVEKIELMIENKSVYEKNAKKCYDEKFSYDLFIKEYTEEYKNKEM